MVDDGWRMAERCHVKPESLPGGEPENGVLQVKTTLLMITNALELIVKWI